MQIQRAQGAQAPSMGKITTESPVYDKASKEFRQTMTFRSSGIKINGQAIARITDYAASTFFEVLRSNGFDDVAWPPEEVICQPHADQMGAAFVFATRADKKRPIILQ